MPSPVAAPQDQADRSGNRQAGQDTLDSGRITVHPAGIRRSIADHAHQQPSKLTDHTPAPDKEVVLSRLSRERIIAHAATVANEWSAHLATLSPASSEYRELREKRDLVSKSLIAADVYSASHGKDTLPAHIARLRPEDLKGYFGSALDGAAFSDRFSGYFSALYFDTHSKTFYLANRGSGDLADWINNSQQAVGLPAKQYEQAIELGYAVKAAIEQSYGKGVKLEFIGHSLGGGLASAQAIALPDTSAVTFNAAGLHRQTVARYNSTMNENTPLKITAYHVKGEILTVVQGNLASVFRGAIAPEAAGTPVVMVPTTSIPRMRPVAAFGSSLKRHTIRDVMCEVLRVAEP